MSGLPRSSSLAAAAVLFLSGSALAHVVEIGNERYLGPDTSTLVVLSATGALTRVTAPAGIAADLANRLSLANAGDGCVRTSVETRALPRFDAVQADVAFDCGGHLRTLEIHDHGLGYRTSGGDCVPDCAEPLPVNHVLVVAGAERLAGTLSAAAPATALPIAQAVWDAGTTLPDSVELPVQPEHLTQGYFTLGFLHVITGFDHLAFLAGLLLLAPTLAQTGALVTAFTLAHSLTLAISVLGTFSPPPLLVEILIAVSVAFVGIENIARLSLRSEARAFRHRWLLTFGFGLIHGFGFAYLLADLGLPEGRLLRSLLLFNIGVEAGQLLVCVAPLAGTILLVRHWSRWRQVLMIGSAAVACVGVYWTVVRIA